MADWMPDTSATKAQSTASNLPSRSASTSISTSKPADDSSPQPGNLPSIKLPKGGGAISGLGESFSINAVTGTASASIPIPTSSSRSGFGPQLAVTYGSGAGNGPFGFGWQLALPSITRKTSKGLPLYRDAENSDVFILEGAEDLMPVLSRNGDGEWKVSQAERLVGKEKFSIETYRPRVEGLFSRVERWTNISNGDMHWHTISKDNITSIFGEDENSRVFDPKEPSHIFAWYASRTYDDSGNLMVFEYKAENSQGVDLMKSSESRRSPLNRTAVRYPKRIRYGNRVSTLEKEKSAANDFMFEVVFDYGDHDLRNPTPAETQPWPARRDPFSSYRSCFEMRTYRLCQRILMFHHFPDEKDIGQDLLVTSVDFSYDGSSGISVRGNAIATCLSSATKKGYYRGEKGYISQTLPPVEFKYSEAKISQDIKTVDRASLANVPIGASGPYQWLDLDGEGVSGIVTRQGGGYFYKPNLGNGKLGPSASLPHIPDLFYNQNGSQQWLDLAGDGHVDLVQFDGKTPGFFKRNPSVPGGWEGFKTFLSQPSISMANPNSMLLDLTGDGLADILITDDDIFTWFPGWAEAGFGPANYWRPPLDEDNGPHILLSDGTEMVQSADMSGDGLNDLVRIRNGEVCYWPNLGYGYFGTKVSMDNSPWFDLLDQFSQTRLRLADIDGSGTTDLIYLAADGPKAFLNLSGNGWSHAHHIHAFPRTDDTNDVEVLDFLGRGTACLVWSSQLLADSGRQMKYLDLMSAGKPYLLKSIVNNLGTETHISYSTSTQFYLEDKARGQPWATRLPFPVHVVKRQEILDRISRNRFVTRYSYKHGYYDGREREFRGFGLVESLDTEDFDVEHKSQFLSDASNLDPAFKSPPVLTKTWYHTGAYFEDESIIRQFKKEYYKEPGLGTDELKSISLPETFVPRSIQDGSEEFPYTLSAEEAREAYRSLKGHTLHQEVYALDGSERQSEPYKLTESSFGIKMFQPKARNKYAVFFSYDKETVNFSYERTLYSTGGQEQKRADPRVSHSLVLATDEFGNVLSSLSIAYGRRYDDKSPLLNKEDRKKQRTSSNVLTLHKYTNIVDQQDSYRTPVPYESLTFEIGNWPRPPVAHFVPLIKFSDAFETIQSLSDGHSDVPFQDFLGATAIASRPFRRLLSHDRVLYRRNDLDGPLPLGQLQSLALPFQSYGQIFTPSLAHDSYVASGKIESVESLEIIFENSCRFTRFEDNDNWWIPSGRSFFSPGTNDTPAEEAAYAEQHFYLTLRHRDPFYSASFNTESSITYDRYDLLILDTRDALGNRVTVGTRELDPSKPIQPAFDYRVLGPKLVMDANRNCTATGYDLLGEVTATAIMGKPEEQKGDSLTEVELFLKDEDVNKYLKDPLAHSHLLLGGATTRTVYDFWAYYRAKGSDHPPVVAATIQRETHVSDLSPGERSGVQQSFLYSDGFGRVIQTKSLTESDPCTKKPRWIASGWTIFNNKGSPVRKYEPFFTDTNLYEPSTTVGVSSVLFYDPLQRKVAMLKPNHAWSKVVFDPWTQETWDNNDTLLIDPRNDVDMAGYFRRLPDADYLPTWYDARIEGKLGEQQMIAARKGAVHADTPSTSFFDSLGRSIVSVSRNKLQRSSDVKATSEIYITRAIYDISGNARINIDAMNRTIQRVDVNMLNQTVRTASMEAGEMWSLTSSIGKPAYTWNSRGFQFSKVYDQTQRQIELYVQHGKEVPSLVSKTLYGESEPDSEAHNWRARTVKTWDQAGLKFMQDYDFKGNLLSSQSRYTVEYSSIIDWSSGQVPLEVEVFSTSTTYDALNRATTMSQPDHSIIRPRYNKTNQIQSIDVNLRGDSDWQPYLKTVHYNARNQRVLSVTGNGVRTKYEYDPFTFTIVDLVTSRNATSFPEDCPKRARWSGCQVQSLHYTYDAMQNIAHVQDDAQQTIFFKNRRVDPSSSYTYDATYRIIESTGREHLGQAGDIIPYGPTDTGQTGIQSPSDGNAMARYTENYFYDATGNMLSLQHNGTDSSRPGWTRYYSYTEPSQLVAGEINNRLSSTRIGRQTEYYRYDGNEGLMGNITSTAHLPLMKWDFRDQLWATAAQRVVHGTPETTWYSYAESGQRARKITERQATGENKPIRKTTRMYQGAFEVFREYESDGTTIKLERTTLQVMNGEHRIALVETRTRGQDRGLPQLTRYQYANNLESAVIELDENAKIISYEEYYSFGSSSYQAVRSQTDTPKRYRYTGKERDEESGLYYHGARYYAPWIARWISPDPGGLGDGLDLYVYVNNRPTVMADPTGNDGSKQTGDYPVSAWKKPPDPMVLVDIGGVGRIVRESEVEGLRLQQLNHTLGITGKNPVSNLFVMIRSLFTSDPNQLQKAAEDGEPVWGVAQAMSEGGTRTAHNESVSNSSRPRDEVTEGPPPPPSETEPSEAAKPEESKPNESTAEPTTNKAPLPPAVQEPAAASPSEASGGSTGGSGSGSGGRDGAGNSSPNSSFREVQLWNQMNQIAQESADTVAALLAAKDQAGLLKAGVSPKYVNINPGQPGWEMRFGKAAEQVAAATFAKDPILSQLLRYTAATPGRVLPNNATKPDWGFMWRIGTMEFILEMTTPDQVKEHLERPGWEHAIIITYRINIP